MKRRKLIVVLMASALSLGLLAGCGGDSKSGGSSGDGPITLTYFNADTNNDNWDNPVAKAITEATGVTLKISYPVGSTGDAAQDIALMIAEGKYPDLIYAKGSATDLYDAGALIDMTDLIEEYGPNIKKMYGDEFKKLRWGNGDDGIYQLSAYGVNASTLNEAGTCQIQWAVLKENNYKYPTTLEEYEKMIKDYLAAHPTTDAGVPMIGISMSASDWHWMITLGNPAGFIADAQPDNGQWIIDENYQCSYKHQTPEEKEYFKWLSRMYDEKILDPQFDTQTDEDYIAKLSNGQVVAITDAFWHYGYSAHAALKQSGMLDKTYAGLPVTLRADQKAPTLQYQGLQVGWGIGITTSCQDPVRAIKFLDYICSDEGAVLYKWGIEGENYELDENGMRYRPQEEIERSQTDSDYSKKTGIGNYTGFPIWGDGAVDEKGNPYTPTTRESIIAQYNEEQQAACKAWGVEMVTDIFPQPDEFPSLPYSALWAYQIPQELSDAEKILNEIAWPGLVKCVKGGQANFDANWDAMVAEMEKNGLRDTEKMMTEFLADKIN